MELTGSVLAVPDVPTATRFWADVCGLVPGAHAADSSRRSTLWDTRTRQVLSIIRVPRPDPALALALRTREIESDLARLAAHGYKPYWHDDGPDGTSFAMCRADAGSFVLLYATPPAEQ